MKVLVTGGSGFIGSHVVDRLIDAGHEPVIFDLRPSPWHERGEVETVEGDLLETRALRKAMADCDAVAHLAAAADVGEVAEDPEGSERLNARGTLAVLEAARQAGVKRIVYASTIWVYDGCGAGAEVDEDSLLGAPSHLYTATKLAGEHYCNAYAELYGLEPTILRFGIPYGPRARPAAVIPIFVRKALAGESLTVAGTGEQSRRFVYVEDLAEGVVRGLAPEAAGRVYNLVGDEDVSIRQIAETVQQTVGDVEIESVPGRAGDFAGARVDGTRAEAELGWTAATPFSEGLRRYVDWAREQDHVPVRAVAARGLRLSQVTLGLWAFVAVLFVGWDAIWATVDERAFATGAALAAIAVVLAAAPGRIQRQAGTIGLGLGTAIIALFAISPTVRSAIGVGAFDREAAALTAVGIAVGRHDRHRRPARARARRRHGLAEDRRQSPRRGVLEDRRQRPRRSPPRPRRGVEVRVVEQHDVTGRERARRVGGHAARVRAAAPVAPPARPQDGSQPGAARRGERRPRVDAVRRAVHDGAHARGVLDDAQRADDVVARGAGRAAQQQPVPVAVDADRVPRGDDLPGQRGPALDLLADEEERRAGAGGGERVEHGRRALRMRAVVERQPHAAGRGA